MTVRGYYNEALMKGIETKVEQKQTHMKMMRDFQAFNLFYLLRIPEQALTLQPAFREADLPSSRMS